MADILPPAPIDAQFGSYNWVDWYKKVRDAINNGGTISWNQITSFTGSNLNSLETREHNDLQTIQGGISDEYYHLTAAEHTTVAAIGIGVAGSVVLAKLTLAGTNGSLTFINGIITAFVAPT